ncbi:TetR/AcrR family transcriptional regulator [Cytobacillus kochii]|uniref:TetR/AcrR family transcriptional regulator n=1 Tax=Cytobacillus kochii TaxID=859143 RepID=UPI002E1B2D8C|nr:TetR/AcrR family transcriptional regulator [Cytobacillus kochii]
MPLSEKQIQNMELRKKKILEAAMGLFATEGYEGTTIKKVSVAANVSFGSVFTYFKDKEALFYTVVVEPLTELKERVLFFDETSADPLLETKQMLREHFRAFAEMNRYLQLVVQVVGQHERYADVFKELDEFHDVFRVKVGKLVQNGQQIGVFKKQDPLIVATLYTSLLIGVRLNSTDNRYSDVWEQYAVTALNLFAPTEKVTDKGLS